MLIKIFCLHREQILLVARRGAYVGGNQTVMQFLIADWQKTHNCCLGIGGRSHKANPFASGKFARPAEGDGRCEEILNLRIAGVNDLPELAFTKGW